MSKTELSALRALEQAVRDCGLPEVMVSGTARLENIAAALKGVEDAREAAPQASQPIGQPEHERDMLVSAIRDVAVSAGICREDAYLTGPHLLMLCADVTACIKHLEAQSNSQPVSGAGMTDAELRAKFDEWCKDKFKAGTVSEQIAWDAWQACSLLSASGQAVSEKAARDAALGEAANICEAVGYAHKEYKDGAYQCRVEIRARAATPAQQTEAPVNVASELTAKVVETINDYINTNKLHAPLGERYTQEWVNGFDEALEGSRSPLIYRVKSIFDSLAAAPAPVQTQQSEKDAEDAARWRALLGSARIRPLGSAGIMKPEAGNYAHLGLELWTVFGRDYSQELLDRLDRENATGVEWLTKYADIAAIAKGKAK